ncbi:MAG: hypothetical protein A3B10_02580 [Candidatus Doudnabacteria bacterium RIFCSPLOWO2_01_FULL_44_21]|uniref:Uncharacterized protein n=1 Tax=Candidatus Doudnabacteria bacterium RIFCSPLOWO2_01_FULL_44_21 TaxID=1817841 RepID=A0A1F5PX76_9BACT|nr:MAG: hypothetical protein A3B95_00870 [Candidatus Doudnabacteria bacterium RIFCSPHIGHO2_02_FULL_43_13b]OGE94513.1 MAG: hypothetical protein A3B10_02580 [Candidatus Doudnabacteria bacterium RIFCSPLOWO2_01_FULL_44_21]
MITKKQFYIIFSICLLVALGFTVSKIKKPKVSLNTSEAATEPSTYSFPTPFPYTVWQDADYATKIAVVPEPQYLQKITDPLSGSNLTKISTNIAPFTLNSQRYANSYSKGTVETGNYVILNGSYPIPILDRSKNYAFVKYLERGITYGDYPSQVTAGRIWGVRNAFGPEFGYVDIVNDQATLVRSFRLDGYSEISFGGGEGTPSNNERYFTFILRRGSTTAYPNTWDVISYDAVQNRILGKWETRSTFNLFDNTTLPRIDHSQVSQLGNYILVSVYADGQQLSITGPDGGGTLRTLGEGMHIFNRNMVWQRQLNNIVNHGDMTRLADGRTETFTQLVNGLTTYILSSGAAINTIPNSPTDYLGWTGHVSGRNINRPGYAYLSSTPSGNGYDSNRPAYNKIWSVELQTGQVEEWSYAHHNESVAGSYNQSPFPVPSADGTRVYFGAAWHSTDTTTPAFLYVVDRTSVSKPNLALGKPVNGDTNLCPAKQYTPNCLTDGDYGFYGQAYPGSSRLSYEVDLQSPKILSVINVVLCKSTDLPGNCYGYNYKGPDGIFGNADDTPYISNWKLEGWNGTAWQSISSGGVPNTKIITAVPTFSMSKIKFTAGSPANLIGAYELEAY